MSSDYDATEFVDGDFQNRKSPFAAANQLRAPTREEVDTKVAQAQQELASKKRELEECERKRAALEETRRRQIEFETGRQEMIHNLTRGVGLLEEAEFNARRDAEQSARALADFRDALSKIQAIHEEHWSKDNLEIELTRSLTILENARMEWNSARLKVPALSDPAATETLPETAAAPGALLGSQSFGQLCRLGLALTWPLAVIALLGAAALIVLLFLR